MGLFDYIPDWNNNGQHDAGDAYIDYMIAHQALGIPVDDNGTPVNTDDSSDDD